MTRAQRAERIQDLRDLRVTLVDRQRKLPDMAGQIEILIDSAHREVWKLLESGRSQDAE